MPLRIQIEHKGVVKFYFEDLTNDKTLLDGTEFPIPTTVVAQSIGDKRLEVWQINVYSGKSDGLRIDSRSDSSVLVCKKRPKADFYPDDEVRLIAEFVE